MMSKTVPIAVITVCLGFLAFQRDWSGLVAAVAAIAFTMSAVRPSNSITDEKPPKTPTEEALAMLEVIPGITAANRRDFEKALPIMSLKDGSTMRSWKNPAGVDHVFLASAEGKMLYGGYVGWIHAKDLQKAIAQIRREFT